MIWDKVIGQGDAVKKLRVAVDKEQISHAFLFWGPEGAGKKRAAKALAAALNCSKKGCGSCLSCKKVLEEIHPDVYQIHPEGNTFTIDQVRSLHHLVNLKLFEGKAKIFILEEVDRMNAPAANAFLKTLEEPPSSTFFILIATQLDSILPTIISRCQTIRFRPISISQIKNIIAKEKGLREREAELFSRVSCGILERAISLAESEDARTRRELILTILSQLNKMSLSKLLDSATSLISKIKEPLSSMREKQEEKLEEILEFATSSAHSSYLKRRYIQNHKRALSRKEHTILNEFFSYCSSWYADIMLIRQDIGEELVRNFDYLEEIKAKSNFLKEEGLLEALEIISQAREMVQRNVNPQLVLESMLLKLQNLEQ